MVRKLNALQAKYDASDKRTRRRKTNAAEDPANEGGSGHRQPDVRTCDRRPARDYDGHARQLVPSDLQVARVVRKVRVLGAVSRRVVNT